MEAYILKMPCRENSNTRIIVALPGEIFSNLRSLNHNLEIGGVRLSVWNWAEYGELRSEYAKFVKDQIPNVEKFRFDFFEVRCEKADAKIHDIKRDIKQAVEWIKTRKLFSGVKVVLSFEIPEENIQIPIKEYRIKLEDELDTVLSTGASVKDYLKVREKASALVSVLKDTASDISVKIKECDKKLLGGEG